MSGSGLAVTVEYGAQAREAAGTAEERLEVREGATVGDLLLGAAARHGDSLRRLLVDGNGRPHPSVLVFVDGERVAVGDPRPLRPGERVVVMTPIGGG